MPRVPPKRATEVARILERAGFGLVHTKGSHHYYRKGERLVMVPMHRGDLAKGTFFNIRKRSELSDELFLKKGKNK